MPFVHVNYALNEVYRVERTAVEQIVRNVLASMRNIRMKSCVVEMGRQANEITIRVKAAMKKDTPFKGVVEKASARIEQLLVNLVNTRAGNITLEISELY